MYSTSNEWKENIYKNIQSALNIYIDNELINPDYILEFKVGQTLFDDEELRLGSISSKYIEFKIYKDKMPTNMRTVKVDYGILINHALTVAEVNAMLVGTLNGIKVKSLSANDSSFEMIPIGIFNIDDWTDNDDNTLTIKCIDNMSKFEFNYDGSKLEYPTTLLTVLQDICSKAGVELGSTSFLNSNIQVATYDNTVSAREYLSYISECAGGFAFIGRDGKLYIRTIYQDEQEIALELFGEYKWGDKYKISKVSYENGVESFKFGDDTGNNLWINQDNMYIVEDDEVKNIYNQLKGLETYSFEGKVIIDPALDVGDKIIIDGKSVIYQGEADFQTRFIAEISSKISIKQKQETTVKTTSQKVLNRRVQSSIDEINGKITQVVQETTANTEKLSKHEQTLDSITDTLKSVETTVETVDNKVDTAQSTADTANQNAQNAQQIANNAVSQITTTTQKVTEIEQTVDGITQSVSNVEEKVETVETKADNAQKSANTANTNATNAQNTANSINDNLTTNYYTKTETNSEINQKADEISSTVSKTYSTKTETTQAKQDAINSANASTDEKLEDYSTTEEMNSAITQKADSITSEVSKTYSTKTETTNAKNAAINSANSSTDNKLKNYSTTTQMNSAITQSANAINTTVSKKVGKNEVISSINQSSESIKINADKIELTANDVLNLLAGNTINLSGKEITMTSDHLNIDSNGKITITDEGTSTSYYFEIKKINSNNNLKIGSYEISITNSLANSFIRAGEIGTSDNSGNQIYFNPNTMQFITASNITTLKASGIETPHITVNDGGNKNVTIEGNGYLGCDSLYVDATGINCVGNIQAHSHIYCNNGVEPFSLAEKKRDIEKYNNKALNEVLNTDIYYYNYKEDAENIKRRVGAIIGTDYKCSKVIIGTEGKGIDLYSMISVAYKAIQEQQELIEKQNKTIENLTAKVEKLEKTIEELTARVEKLEKAGEA